MYEKQSPGIGIRILSALKLSNCKYFMDSQFSQLVSLQCCSFYSGYQTIFALDFGSTNS